MGDMRECYDDMKEIAKKDRVGNLSESKIIFDRHGIKYESKNDGLHWVVTAASTIFDFYPTTHKWKRRGSKKWNNGISEFLLAYHPENNKETI